MTGQTIPDLIPREMRALAEQSVRQAKQACDDWMAATQRAVASFEGQALSVQADARALQHKVMGFSERNVAMSLEFAEKLLRAQDTQEVLRLHAEYVQTQIQTLGEQARELGRQTSQTAQDARQANPTNPTNPAAA